MTVDYADIWAYADRIEIRKHGQVAETIPVDHPEDESWHDFVGRKVSVEVRRKGYLHNGFHRPKDNEELLATTFAWREPGLR